MPTTVRTQQEATTSLPAADVLAAATTFFAEQNGVYSAFPEKSGATFVALRGQGGEDVLFGVELIAGGTRVTGSSYMFDAQIARFLATLPRHVPPPEPLVLPPDVADAATSAAPAA
jgi:hypothetical protein